jgi:hypothetical protein
MLPRPVVVASGLGPRPASAPALALALALACKQSGGTAPLHLSTTSATAGLGVQVHGGKKPGAARFSSLRVRCSRGHGHGRVRARRGRRFNGLFLSTRTRHVYGVATDVRLDSLPSRPTRSAAAAQVFCAAERIGFQTEPITHDMAERADQVQRLEGPSWITFYFYLRLVLPLRNFLNLFLIEGSKARLY